MKTWIPAIFINIVVVIIIFILTACDSNYTSHQLKRAETIMNENPDSALMILESLSKGNLIKTKRDSALYALLVTEGRYKSGIDEKSDSLISVATKFYEPQYKNVNRVKAHYYNGIINKNNLKTQEAVINMLSAEKGAILLTDTLRLGLIHRALGDLFRELDDYSVALRYYEASFHEFSSINDPKYTEYSKYDLAHGYLRAMEYDSCKRISLEIFEAGKLKDSKSQQYNAQSLIAAVAIKEQDYKLAEKRYADMAAEFHDEMNVYDRCMYGLAALENGNIPVARRCDDIVMSKDSTVTFLHMNLLCHDGRYEEAFNILKEEMSVLNEDIKNKMAHNYTATLMDYYNMQDENNRLKLDSANKDKIFISVLAVLILLIAAYVIFRLRKSNKKKRRQFIENILSLKNEIFSRDASINSLMQEISVLKSNLDNVSKNLTEKEATDNKKDSEPKDNICIDSQASLIKDAHDEIYRLFSSQFDILDGLFQTYYRFKGTDKEIEMIYKGVVSDINLIINDRKWIDNLRKNVNVYMDNLLNRLEQYSPSFKEKDIDLYLFLLLHFSTNTICLFLNISADTLYTRKRNLKRKIQAKCGNYAEYFISFIK